MKKLLLVTTAIAGVAFLSAPASAEVKLDLGGYFAGYGVFTDHDEPAGTSLREFDLRRDTEVHVSGETTLDNGLTVGFHTEQALGGATLTDEAYAYFSGSWGRVNLGSEDGAAYLLQVAAPSADSNVDGLRTYIQAISAVDTVLPAASAHNVFTTGLPGLRRNTTIDYDHVSDSVNNTDRLTYMTPKFNGFQAGVSYAPETAQNAVGNNVAAMAGDNNLNDYEDIWEAGVRWDGEFQGFGLSVGGGYSQASLEAQAAAPALNAAPIVSDDLTTWNLGANLTWSGFSLGGGYMLSETENLDRIDADGAGGGAESNVSVDAEQETWVVGAGWENGPYRVGLSYLEQTQERDASGNTAVAASGTIGAVDAEVNKFTVGAGYTFGPGMTFRGAVAFGEFDNAAISTVAGSADGVAGGLTTTGATAASSQDFTQVTVGTDIQF